MSKIFSLPLTILKAFLGSVFAACFYLTTGIAITLYFLVATTIDAAISILLLDSGSIGALLASLDRRLFYRVQALRALLFSWRVRLMLSHLKKSVQASQYFVLEEPGTSASAGVSIVPSSGTDASSQSPTVIPLGRKPCLDS
jgi:hypothetical protein